MCPSVEAPKNIVCAQKSCGEGARRTLTDGEWRRQRRPWLSLSAHSQSMPANSGAKDASIARSAPGIICTGEIRKVIGNSGSMAAFLLVIVDQLVLLTCLEWCKTAHSVVICMDQALLKRGSRPAAHNFQLAPPGGPTALSASGASDEIINEDITATAAPSGAS